MATARKVEADPEPNRHRSVPQAAKALGVANATVYVLALKRELDFEIVADRVFITQASINAYNARHTGQQAARGR